MINQPGQGRRLRPRFEQFTVLAVFDSGTEVDQRLVLINYAKAEQLAGANGASRGLRLSLSDSFVAPQVAWALERELPYGFYLSDWTRSHGNLYSAIQLSRKLVGLMLLTIIAVAAFNVVSALVMVVTDKRGDIAILRTMGASPRAILGIFMLHGTVIGVAGAGLGALLGGLFSLGITDMVLWLEQQFGFQFLNTDVYPVDYVPADLRWLDVLRVCATGFVMSLLATIYPAWRAARVQPAQALRYD